jgi:hypothetical protein
MLTIQHFAKSFYLTGMKGILGITAKTKMQAFGVKTKSS